MKAFLKSWLGHLAGYVASGAGIVAAVDPTFLPPVGKLAVAGASLVVIVGHHAYTAGTGVSAVQAAVNAAVAALSKVPPAAMLVLLALGSGFGLTGCATIQGFFSSPAAAPVITAAVQVAVTTAEQNGITAAQINGIATQALAADQGTGATLASVASLVNVELQALKLPAGDLTAATIFEGLLETAIQAKIGSNQDLAAAETDVASVLQAVIVATAPPAG